MSFSWMVYSSLSPKDALALEDRLRVAIDALLESRPSLVKPGTEWGEVTVGEAVPSADDVAELAEAYDREVSEDVLDRLDACRSVFEIERNGTNDLDPMQVSILHWLLDNLPPCLVDWGDFQIVASEVVRGDLADFPTAGSLASPSAKDDPSPAEGMDDETGEVHAPDVERAVATGDAIMALSEDPFLQRRFLKLLDKYPEYVKNYVKILEKQGPLSDEKAADELDVPLPKLAKQLEKLHELATGLAGEADKDE